jgi:predicted amidohydrolase YtcJ
MIGVAGCDKKSAEAVVIGKDYVAATKEGEEIKRGAGNQSRTVDCESANAR